MCDVCLNDDQSVQVITAQSGMAIDTVCPFLYPMTALPTDHIQNWPTTAYRVAIFFPDDSQPSVVTLDKDIFEEVTNESNEVTGIRVRPT